ncbi:hypothetical protein CEXT_522601 [Caerostris extrusa]|uniref:Uncharacterized protein n=1 Tax=Caerostris extrusa TaxID=172846 RepID=A0AAV4MQ34_CAEEX|nr:hypothetical protein CEXT_522601 [Caerostris extrusa]
MLAKQSTPIQRSFSDTHAWSYLSSESHGNGRPMSITIRAWLPEEILQNGKMSLGQSSPPPSLPRVSCGTWLPEKTTPSSLLYWIGRINIESSENRLI